MTNTQHQVEVSRVVDALADEPDDPDICSWIISALNKLSVPGSEVSVRIVDQVEIRALNNTYRGKDAPTNVLSFESDLKLPDSERQILGDIVLCSEVVYSESAEFNKMYRDRYAHMLIHGLLHLLGHDHETEEDRKVMESIEIDLLSAMQISDPYEMVMS